MKKISIVIPALNEEKGIGKVIQEIPVKKLRAIGYETEILVVDNGSTDNTARIAKLKNATVIFQPLRGYGNAYKAGFSYATGDIIATGDSDFTYPFSILPAIIKKIEKEHIDFITTDRLTYLNPGVMKISHQFGNWLLTLIIKLLYGLPFRDSQSGMWIFKSKVWKHLRVASDGMSFSQELKIEVFKKGFKCAEIHITYRPRVGQEKLHIIQDGMHNLINIFKKRFSAF